MERQSAQAAKPIVFEMSHEKPELKYGNVVKIAARYYKVLDVAFSYGNPTKKYGWWLLLLPVNKKDVYYEQSKKATVELYYKDVESLLKKVG